MKQLKVLLACGSGASSGFMASNMRKAAAENNVDADIHAVSDSEIPEYIDKVDVIMLGPHVKYLEEELKKKLLFMVDRWHVFLNRRMES